MRAFLVLCRYYIGVGRRLPPVVRSRKWVVPRDGFGLVVFTAGWVEGYRGVIGRMKIKSCSKI